ncbi:MAG: hypothetical protein ACI85K_000242 [Hyphomicrobiaceae bacterium]|jgi:uncharacterized protein involved in exopolysaccharide biosynthesis
MREESARSQGDEASRGGSARQVALLKTLLAGTIRRWGLIMLIAFLSMIVAGLYAITRPAQYRSGGKLFVLPGNRGSFVSQSAFSGGEVQVVSSRETINNEMQVLSAPAFFDLVAEKVGIETVLAPFDPGETSTQNSTWYRDLVVDIQSWWFAAKGGTGDMNGFSRANLAREVLSKSVIIVPEPGTSIISCYGFAHSSELAQKIVTGVLEAVSEMHGRVFNNIAGVEKVREESRVVEMAARETEKALQDYRSQYGYLEDDSAQLVALQEYRAEIGLKFNEIAVATALLQEEQGWLMKTLKAIPVTQIAPGSVVSVLNPEYTVLTDELKSLRQALTTLSQDRSITAATNEQRKDALDAQVLDVATRLEQTKIAIEIGGYVERYPEHVRMTDRLRVVDLELKKLERENKERKNLHKSVGEALDKLAAAGPGLRLLELDAAQQRGKADKLAAGLYQLEAVQNLDKLNLSSVQLLQTATYDPERMSIGRTRVVLIGMLGGGFAGVALALLLAFFDGRVRSGADLVLCGLPKHGVLRSRIDTGKSGKPWSLSQSLVTARTDIDTFWKSIPFDCREREGVSIAFVPCGSADAGRAAASLAIGLAAHCGERVAYLSLSAGQAWFTRRIAVKSDPDWRDHIMASGDTANGDCETTVPGLYFYGAGNHEGASPDLLAGPHFVALLDRLRAQHRFVILELPNAEDVPSADAVLGAVEAAMLVVTRNHVSRKQVGHSLSAAASAGARILGVVMQAQSASAETDPEDPPHAGP